MIQELIFLIFKQCIKLRYFIFITKLNTHKYFTGFCFFYILNLARNVLFYRVLYSQIAYKYRGKNVGLCSIYKIML